MKRAGNAKDNAQDMKVRNRNPRWRGADAENATAAFALRVEPALKAAVKRAAKRIGMREGEFIRLTLMAAVRS